MNSTITPEAAQPCRTQAWEQGDRDPQVMFWEGTEAEDVEGEYSSDPEETEEAYCAGALERLMGQEQ